MTPTWMLLDEHTQPPGGSSSPSTIRPSALMGRLEYGLKAPKVGSLSTTLHPVTAPSDMYWSPATMASRIVRSEASTISTAAEVQYPPTVPTS